MKRLTYVGSMSDVVLETGTVVKKGEAVTLPDEVAKRYADQPENFKVEDDTAPKAAKKGGAR